MTVTAEDSRRPFVDAVHELRRISAREALVGSRFEPGRLVLVFGATDSSWLARAAQGARA